MNFCTIETCKLAVCIGQGSSPETDKNNIVKITS